MERYGDKGGEGGRGINNSNPRHRLLNNFYAGFAHPAGFARTPALRAGVRRTEYAEAQRNAYEVRSIYRLAGELQG